MSVGAQALELLAGWSLFVTAAAAAAIECAQVSEVESELVPVESRKQGAVTRVVQAQRELDAGGHALIFCMLHTVGNRCVLCFS